jgi:hypothetical protein
LLAQEANDATAWSKDTAREVTTTDILVHQAFGMSNNPYSASFRNDEQNVSLLVPTVDVGTPEEVRKNKLYVARHNTAKAVHILAAREYAEREEKVRATMERLGHRYIDVLYRLVAAGEQNCEASNADDPFSQKQHILRRFVCQTEGQYPGMSAHGKWCFKLSEISYDHRYYTCPFYDTKASLHFQIIFYNAEHFMEVMSCSRIILPDVMQYWQSIKPYTGNHILDNVDPMEWAVKNPWNNEVNYVISLSKRGLKKVQKMYG